MRIVLATTILLATGCNVPSPAFVGAEMQKITVDGSTFDVRSRGNHAELIRTNPELVYGMQSILPKASRAVSLATGCTPLPNTWQGDAAMMRVEISCPQTSEAGQ